MAVRLRARRDTLANWQSVNPIIGDGEFAVVKDGANLGLKLGDGVSNFSSLQYWNPTEVIDNLTSTFIDKPLSANQGRVLKGLIDSINNLLLSDNSALDSLQEIVDFIEINKDTLDTLGIASIAGLQTALDSKADKATTLAGYGITDADTSAIVSSKISTAVANLIASSPATLDTLDEIAQALGDDPNFATTITSLIGTKVTKVISTDNAIVRFDGITGAVQDSNVTLDDTDRFNNVRKMRIVDDNTGTFGDLLEIINTDDTSFQAIVFEGDTQSYKIGSTNSNDGTGLNIPNNFFIFNDTAFTLPFLIDSNDRLLAGTSYVAPTLDNQLAPKKYVDDTTSTKVTKVISTDNAIVRFDGTDGTVQNSGVFINEDSNVGIGTQAPTRQLDIASSSTVASLSLNNQSVDGLQYTMFSTGTASGLGVGKFVLYDDTNNVSRFTVDGVGNVGIGTTTPTEKLDIDGNIRLTSSDVTNNTIQNSIIGSKYSTNGGAKVNFYRGTTFDDSALSFSTSKADVSTERMFISEDGNVGVGTNLPTKKINVEVASGEESSVLFSEGNDNTGGIFGYNGGDNTIFIGSINAGLSETKRLTIERDTGNIGIGTTTPRTELEVRKGLNATNQGGRSDGQSAIGYTGNNFSYISGKYADNPLDSARISYVFTGTGQQGYLAFDTKNIADDDTEASTKMVIKENGNVEHFEFTKLGSDAPLIKQKKFTATTGSAEGGIISILHELDYQKVLSIDTFVESGNRYAPNFTYNNGFEYSVYLGSINIRVANSASNSSNILSAPVTVLVTYED